MNRSNFYYDQEVREQELDQIYDDAEAVEQNIIIDFDLWGVLSGLEIAERSVPDLTVKVAEGAGHDREGRRIVAGSSQIVDLSSYVPTTGPGYERYVDIYGIDHMDESDPRIDGHSNPVNFRQTEGIDFLLVAGAEATGGGVVPAAENTEHLPLGRVLLTYGQTQILDANIFTGYREDIEIVWRKNRVIRDDLDFSYSPGTYEYSITQAVTVELAPQQSMGEKGFDANGRSVEDAGFMSMRTGGNGFDMNSNEITECGGLTLSSGTIDLDGNDLLAGAGTIDLEGGTLLGGAGTIDMEDGTIDMGGGIIEEMEQLNFETYVSGARYGIDLNNRNLIDCYFLQLSSGADTFVGLDTNGKSIETGGGNIDLAGVGDGNIVNAYAVECYHLRSNIDVIADYDASTSGDFKYGLAKSYTLHLSASQALYRDDKMTYNPGAYAGGGGTEYPALLGTGSGGSQYWACVPFHLPQGAKITAIRHKVYDNVAGNEVTVRLEELDLNLDSPGTAPARSNLNILNTTGTPGITELSATGLSIYVSAFRVYEIHVQFGDGLTNLRYYGSEIDYEYSTIKGLV